MRAAPWSRPLADVAAHARSAWPTRPTPTPDEAAKRAVADGLALRAARTATDPAVDEALAAAFADAVKRTRTRLGALPAQGGTPLLNHLPRVAQAAVAALILSRFSEEGWLGRTALLSVGNYLPKWSGRLMNLPGPIDAALGAGVRRAEADQVLFAQHKLLEEVREATRALGPVTPAVPAASASLWPRAARTSSRAAAEREVEALAARLDGRRRRLHHVTLRLRCCAAEAATAGADPVLAAHATAQRRGLKVAAVAVALSFVVGYYAQFASVVGLGLVGLVVCFAVAALAYNLRAALDYLAGKASGGNQESERQRERNRTLAALTEAHLAELATSWQAQVHDEQALAACRRGLDALGAADANDAAADAAAPGMLAAG